MAPLALTLALLAMAVVATVAIEVVPLDMAEDSFDDQYRGCGPAMTAALPALNRSEFQKNPLFAEAWVKAVAEWQAQGSRVSPLSSPDHAIAIMAYLSGVYLDFFTAVREAGRSAQHYRDKFHYKTLHFLLTDALATLREALKLQCLDVVNRLCKIQYKAQLADTIRFGQFMPMLLSVTADKCPGEETFFKVHTCHSAGIQYFAEHLKEKAVLIPPFETFKVTDITRKGDKVEIQLRSTGTYSKYNCEWLRGGSVPRAPFHFGGLLLATTALAVATRIL